VIDGLRFLAYGYQLEEKPVSADSPIEFERLRRRVEGLSCLHDDFAEDQRRIVAGRLIAKREIARCEQEARLRVSRLGRKLEVVA
jgi:hypothetical protein